MKRNHPTPTRTHWPEQKPADCYDWITPEEVVRHALAAYYKVSRTLDKLPNDPDESKAEFNNGRRGFADHLSEVFDQRLYQAGISAGAPGFHATKWTCRQLKDDSVPYDIPDIRIAHDIHRTQFRWCSA